MATEMKKVLVDGLTVETTEQGAQAIDKLNKQLADSASTVQALKDAHATALAKKDAEIDSIKAKVLTDAEIDKRVFARTELITKARSVHDFDYAGKTDAEIRRAAVVAKLGDAAVAGKSDAYVDARFDILVEDAAKADPVRDALKDGKPSQPVTDARAAYIAHLETAHKAK